MVASSRGPSRLQNPASLLPPTFTSRRAKTAVFCEVSPHKAPIAPHAEGRHGRGLLAPDAPALSLLAGSNFLLPPRPAAQGWAGAPGTRIGPGAAPEPPKTPLGLLGLVAPVTGADIHGGGYLNAVIS